MALTKVQKQKILQDLKEKIDRQKSIIFGDISGVKVGDLQKLRKKMKESGCEFKVAKKTLINLAFKGKENIDVKDLKGEVALGFGYEDQVIPFKIFYDFSKENENLKIIGGLVGEERLDGEKALAIAKLPTREELLAKLVGSLSAPASKFVGVLEGNLKGLVLILKQIKS